MANEATPMATSQANPWLAAGQMAISAGNGLFGYLGQKKQMAQAERMATEQRNWNAMLMNAQADWDLQMWNRTNEYNSPAEQVKRLRDAGLNPLYYGLDGTSANAFQASQPLGYDRASLEQMQNPFAAGMDTAMQSAQIGLINANAAKARSETDSTYLDNEFKQRTLNARVEAENLANSLTKGQIAKIDDERKQIAENIKKTMAETKNEELKSTLIQAQENLANMQAKEIAEMLPYQKLLMEAQTDAQRAQASLAYANAAIQNGLLKGGYVEKMLDDLSASIRSKNASAEAQEVITALNSIKLKIKDGTWYPTDTDSAILNGINKFGNTFIETIATLGEVITGPLAGVLK